jgi:signal transduction histidine kinase
MPVMDGIEALPHLRAAAPGAKVVVVSGFETARMAQSALDAGAAGYVQKGASITKVVAQVAAVVGLDLSAPAPPPPVPERDLQAEVDRAHAALAAAAHELRGPATVLLAMSELLSTERHTLSEASFHRMLDAIERQARVLDRVTEDLLANAQAERGGLAVEIEAVRLLPTLESAAVAVAASETVQVTCEPDLWVRADPPRVQQIVGNLVSNALKYGAAPYEICAQVVGTAVEIRVVDHGPGVPESFRPRLFDQFTRADGTRGKGIGLGLFVVKSLVHAQGGQLWYEPGGRDGTGAAFAFTLPGSDPPPGAAAPARVAGWPLRPLPSAG